MEDLQLSINSFKTSLNTLDKTYSKLSPLYCSGPTNHLLVGMNLSGLFHDKVHARPTQTAPQL